MADPLYPLASVDNAITLLQLLSRGVPLRLTDAARELEVAPSTAHRLLAMLEHRGFARRRTGSRSYIPGPEFQAVARDVLAEVDLGRIAQSTLEELWRTYNESVLLGVLGADGVRFIAGHESELQLRVAGHFDQAFAPHASASGLVLLAALSPTELRERYPSDRLLSSQPRAIARRNQLERELANVRSQGYSLVVETTAAGVSAVAVPVTTANGTTIAAMTLIAPTLRFPLEKLRTCIRPLRKAASRLRDALD
jgi:DNA-binding IclR family transcriptional regulator